MDSNVKLLAVYEDLLKKIEEVMKVAERSGRDGKDGKDGRNAPDNTGQMFAMIATLHSDLVKQLISVEREVNVTPEINVTSASSAYTFDIERNNKGLIERVQAKPVNSDRIL